MGKKALQLFMKVDALRVIGAESLRALLEDHVELFQERGVDITGDDESFPFDALAETLQCDRDKFPTDLINALYLISEMSDQAGLDMLISHARNAGLIEDDDRSELSSADIAVRLYLHDPAILERCRDSRVVQSKRAYVYFSAERPYPNAQFSVLPQSVSRFEVACNDVFRQRQRGEGVKLRHFPDGDIIRFLVRHGESLTRKGVLQGRESSSIIYRPEMFDAFRFEMSKGILGMPNGPKWQTDLYRTYFGLLLYGDRNAFQPMPLFTFQPIIDRKRDALACAVVREVESIRLTRLEWNRPDGDGKGSYTDVHDVFAAFEQDGHDFPTEGILSARFVFTLRESLEEHYLEIHGDKRINCQRDTDLELLWPWLEAQHFLVNQETATEAAVEEMVDVPA